MLFEIFNTFLYMLTHYCFYYWCHFQHFI